MDPALAAGRRALFDGATMADRLRGLETITANIRVRNFEETSHALLDWPTAADDLGVVLLAALKLGVDDMARAAVSCLGHIFCVGIRPSDLDLLLDVAQARPRLAPAILQAIEDAARSRNVRSKPCSFWALAGWCTAAQRAALAGPPRGGAVPVVQPAAERSESAFLALSWERWPFPREYSLWTMVRVAAFGSGSGEDKTTLLRALAGNGARIHIWVEHKALHVTVQVRGR